MDAGGWLELAVSLLGLGVLAALVAAEEALSLPGKGEQGSDLESTQASGAVAWLRRHPRRTAVALLLYRNLVLVGVSALLAGLLLRLASPRWWAIVLAVAITLLLAFLVQLAMRQYALGHAQGVAQALARPLRVLVLFAYPVIWALRQAQDIALRSLPDHYRLGATPSASDASPDLADAAEPPGEPERRMIQGIIGLSQTTVREIMVPRLDMVAIEENTSLAEVLQLVREQGYSRLPVYRDSIDHVVGVVHVKDLLPLLAQQPNPALAQVVRPPYFIPESKRIDECLGEFQRQRVHMAIVVDEYGGVAGLVTMEDVIEEIVGEIGDEFRREEPRLKRLSEGEAVIDGRVSIADVNEALELNLPSDDFDTIGGLVLTHLGHIPSPGETLEAYGVQLSVVSTLGRRVRQIRLTKKQAEAPAGGEPK